MTEATDYFYKVTPAHGSLHWGILRFGIGRCESLLESSPSLRAEMTAAVVLRSIRVCIPLWRSADINSCCFSRSLLKPRPPNAVIGPWETDKKFPMETAKLLQKVHSSTMLQASQGTGPKHTVGTVSHRVLLSCAYFPLCRCILSSVSPCFIKGWTEICIGVRLAHNCPANLFMHSNILAWRIPYTEQPGGLQPMGLPRAGHGWVTNTLLSHKTGPQSRVLWSRLKTEGFQTQPAFPVWQPLLSSRVRGPWASFCEQLGLVRGAERLPLARTAWAQQACPGLALQPHGGHSPSPSVSVKQGREEREAQTLPGLVFIHLLRWLMRKVRTQEVLRALFLKRQWSEVLDRGLSLVLKGSLALQKIEVASPCCGITEHQSWVKSAQPCRWF